MMKKQMIVQALFAMMLGFAVPVVHAAAQKVEAGLVGFKWNDDEIKVETEMTVDEQIECAEAGIKFYTDGKGKDENDKDENRVKLQGVLKNLQQQVLIDGLIAKNIKEANFDLNAYEVAVNAFVPVTDEQKKAKNVLVKTIEDRKTELAAAAAAAAAAAVKVEVEALKDIDAVKAFMQNKTKQTKAYQVALEAYLTEGANAQLKTDTQVEYAAYNLIVNPTPASTGMSKKTQAGIGIASIAVIYEVSRLLPKMSQLKRRQKHDESLQGKNMFVEAMREEYKAAKRGLNRGYEGLKGFFADADEEDDQEEDQVQA